MPEINDPEQMTVFRTYLTGSPDVGGVPSEPPGIREHVRTHQEQRTYASGDVQVRD